MNDIGTQLLHRAKEIIGARHADLSPVEREFHAKLERYFDHTVQGAAEQIIEMLPGLGLFRKRVQAILKRLVHSEKLEVYTRAKLYFEPDISDISKQWLDQKIETHRRLKDAPDDEVITWPVK